MRLTLVVLSVVAMLVPAGAVAGESFLLGGIQIDEPDVARWVETLDAIGMNTVSVTVYARQGAWNGSDLRFDSESPGIVEEIRAAKARGLHVVLILRVALDHAPPANRFFWHGMIMPSSDGDLSRWFARYEAYVSHWAAIAQEEGVDVLGIGSELKSLTATRRLNWWSDLKLQIGHRWYQERLKRRAHEFADLIREKRPWMQGFEHYPTLDAYLNARCEAQLGWNREARQRTASDPLAALNRRRARLERHWIDLIGRLRGIYDGKLSYAANFDNYHNVGFWKHLDVMGINAYFPLRNGLEPDWSAERKLETFRASWRRVFRDMQGFLDAEGLPGLPVVFTELGYTDRAGSTVEPWAYGGYSVVGWKGAKPRLVIWREQPADPQERVLALRALLDAYRGGAARPLAGLLYWKFSTQPRHVADEPFVMLVGPESADPLQPALLAFVEPAGTR